MGPQPRVSVIITSYQHERYIAQALDGVLEQSPDVPFELLVGDDASTDGTRAIISEYSEAHPHTVRTYFPDRNLGLGGKAIFGELISRSSGEYIAMLDGDDYWTSPDKLRRQVAYMDAHPKSSMCFHNVLCHYEHESRPDHPYNSSDRASTLGMAEVLDRFPMASCSPLFRREALDPLPAWYFEMPWGDWPLYFIAAQHGAIHYLPDVLGVYRLHEDGMYASLPRLKALEYRTTAYGLLPVPPELEDRRRRRLAETWVKRALEHERLSERAAARGSLRRSFAVWPFRPWLGAAAETRRAAIWLLLRTPTALALNRHWAACRHRRASRS